MGKIDEIVVQLYQINFVSAVITTILWISFIFGGITFGKASNSNKALLVLFPVLCIYCAFVPISSILTSLTFISNNNFQLSPTSTVILHCFISFGGNALRWGTLVICLDRFIATYFIQFYIRYGNTRQFGLFLTFIATFICLGMISFHIFGSSGLSTTYIALVTNFCCFFIVLFLIRKNRKLRHFIDNNYTLSGKFQIVENIRLLEIFEIYLILMVSITSCSPLCTTICSIVFPELPSTGRSAIFYTIYNFFLSIVAILGGIQIYYKRKNQKQPFKMFVRSRLIKVGVDDRRRIHQATKAKEEADVYFATLKNAWDQKLVRK